MCQGFSCLVRKSDRRVFFHRTIPLNPSHSQIAHSHSINEDSRFLVRIEIRPRNALLEYTQQWPLRLTWASLVSSKSIHFDNSSKRPPSWWSDSHERALRNAFFRWHRTYLRPLILAGWSVGTYQNTVSKTFRLHPAFPSITHFRLDFHSGGDVYIYLHHDHFSLPSTFSPSSWKKDLLKLRESSSPYRAQLDPVLNWLSEHKRPSLFFPPRWSTLYHPT